MYQIGAASVREFHHDRIEHGLNSLDFERVKAWFHAWHGTCFDTLAKFS
jgi:hypothetical protein